MINVIMVIEVMFQLPLLALYIVYFCSDGVCVMDIINNRSPFIATVCSNHCVMIPALPNFIQLTKPCPFDGWMDGLV